jgi:protein-disulfide isomerase
LAQTTVPAAPAAPQAASQINFPKVDLKNFTADSPTVDEVNSFLNAMWGYDENRVWEVAAILKTRAAGVSKIVVFIADKTQPEKGTSTVFFSTPDGKHAIADKVIDFGAKPFVEDRALLQARADGPAHGAKGNDLMLVEFADLQCPHCKEAQDTMKNLATDFPEAKIVFENFPLTDIHPYAAAAAAEGLCVRKQKGDDAFFTYVQGVYDKQEGLTKDMAAATLNAAATAAGADPKAVAACAATQATKDELAAEIKLGNDVGVDQTPVLVVNGYALPLTALPYNILRRIIAFRASQDGITVHLQPQLTTLK